MKKNKIATDFEHNLIRELIEHKNWLNEEQISVIRMNLTEVHFSNIEILKIFKDDVPNQKEFITEKMLINFSLSFSDNDVENPAEIKTKIGLVLSFKEILTKLATSVLIEKLTHLFIAENKKPIKDREPQKCALLEQATNLVKKLSIQISQIEDPILNNFSSAISQGMNAVDMQQKTMFIPLMIKLKELCPEASKASINSLTQHFFVAANVKSLDSVIKSIGKTTSKEIIKEYHKVLLQPIKRDPQILDLFYPLAEIEIQVFWLKDLTNSPQYSVALNKLASLNYEFEKKNELANILLTRVKTIDDTNKKAEFYKSINGIQCGSEDALKNEFISQIKVLLKQMNNKQQEVGYHALKEAIYLKDTEKRDVIREVIEFLHQLDPSNSLQVFSIRSVFLNWSTLKQQIPAQKDFIDYLFDKLIKRSQNIQAIQLGFEGLNLIKPKYEDYSTYYDDILNEADRQQTKLKTELLNGLLKLKPPKLQKNDRDYWEKVTKFYKESKDSKAT